MSKATQEIRRFLAEAGRKGGLAKSKAKRQTARLNGKRGGRPKKAVA